MSIDIIGTLSTIDATDPLNPTVTTLSGFHVNITPDELTEALEPFVVVPSKLKRVWAGDGPENPQYTVCLKFADEAEFTAIMPQTIQGELP